MCWIDSHAFKHVKMVVSDVFSSPWGCAAAFGSWSLISLSFLLVFFIVQFKSVRQGMK
jgi:hypothetical protein